MQKRENQVLINSYISCHLSFIIIVVTFRVQCIDLRSVRSKSVHPLNSFNSVSQSSQSISQSVHPAIYMRYRVYLLGIHQADRSSVGRPAWHGATTKIPTTAVNANLYQLKRHTQNTKKSIASLFFPPHPRPNRTHHQPALHVKKALVTSR